ncbi:MAG TPA: hypothetical protein VE871_20900 [Longimicrobium sp.]|nr:hypothetical protein [Longimicrobium sp.]
MNQSVTIRREGGALAVAIPEDAAEQMHVGDGDKLYLVQTDHGLALVSTAPSSSESDSTGTTTAPSSPPRMRTTSRP